MYYLKWMFRGFLLAVLLLCLVVAVVAGKMIAYGSSKNDSQYADAALVLGAAAWGNKPSPVFRERIRHAVALYQSGKVRWIVFSGGTPVPGYPSEAEVGRSYALKFGVPMTAMLAETESRTTWGNLHNASRLVAPFGIHSYLLVSDPWHMYRAMLMAHDLGMNAAPSPTDSTRFRTLVAQCGFLMREVYLYIGYLLFKILS